MLQCGLFCAQRAKRLSSRSCPRRYTESLENRLISLQREKYKLKDLLNDKDERIDMFSRVAIGERDNYLRNDTSRLGSPLDIHETENSPVPEGLHINTFEFGRKGYLEVRSAKNQIMRREDVQNWIQGRLELARNVIATPAIRLLVAFTPDGTAAQDNATLRRHQLYEDGCEKLKPALESLQFPDHLLAAFDRVVFDRIPLRPTQMAEDTYPNLDFICHIGFGFFSLMCRHFPESNTSLRCPPSSKLSRDGLTAYSRPR
ncbi:hypothetical protein F4823DRAFT_599039 [Ustulina deusta]|nr:hypothetical protein F4823DRAFT_599039 [Ustulina deusta]